MEIMHLDLTLIVQLISALLVFLLPIGFIVYFVWTKNSIRKDYDNAVAKLDHIIELLERQQKELN